MSSLLNIGSSALTAAQASIATVSHNIANANTPGYSRQEAVLTPAAGQFTGAGFFGRGVDVTTVRRLYDGFLTAAVQSAAAASGADSARAAGLKELDALFASGETGIGAAIDNFFAAGSDMASRPADLSSRQVFIAKAQDLARRISGVGTSIATMMDTADARLAGDAAKANDTLTKVARLNAQIAQAASSGQPPNDLLDQRDAAITSLNQLLSVRSVANANGSVSLFTLNGQPLLVGAQQSRLDTAADPADPRRQALRLAIGGTSEWLDPNALGGGSMAGTLNLRDGDLASALSQVGRIAQSVAAAVNAQQALGVDMSGQPGAPVFNVPALAARADARNSGTQALAATITNTSALVPSDYDVRWDGSLYTITRLADGNVATAATLPTSIDGLSIAATSGTPASGDRWRIQPYAAAATGLTITSIAPRQLATGYAATIQPASTNTGNAMARGFAIVQAGASNTQPVTIAFNNPPTTFNVTGLASGNLTNVPYTPGQAVPPAPADYNGWRVTLDGAPAAGDRFDVGPVTAPGADNRNALALLGLASAPLAGGATLNDSYASLLADVGSRVQAGQALADVSSQLQSDALARQQAASGVDLDQEAADLLRFQQAYQASAKIIQASQSIFEALLAATTR